ncbi:MAG: DUF4982 domain-containing protein [Prevotella sp.]|nr:DUF4982 domain-containing protein [Prevotella sp.]
MKKSFLLFCVFIITCASVAQSLSKVNLKTWQFSRDGRHWNTVNIPHDWAISGPFDKKWDLQRVAIEQNGEREATEKSGRSGALPWIGEGRYRCKVNIDKVRKAVLHFDGAMSEPTVFVNGRQAGYWAYGYNAFRVDITPYVIVGENDIEVRLKNVEESSRWYPGGGLYRPVTLLLHHGPSLDDWNIHAYTDELNEDKAVVAIRMRVPGNVGRDCFIRPFIRDAEGNTVVWTRPVWLDNDGVCELRLPVDHPKTWSPESPYLYTLVLQYGKGGERNVIEGSGVDNPDNDFVLDELTMPLGIRTIALSKEHGFQLNGQSRKFKGVCLHHDLGPLGAAVNKAALIRQIRILKDMGCDAIRTSHNMPSTMQMQVCDSMGMMVMAESFDMWRYPKCKNGYARFFDEWAERDIENLVRNHRNHPCIVMWSIGNEIPEQWSEEGVEISRRLQELCHRLDPTRPVTQGMDRAEDALKSGFAQVMDIPGFNYRVHKYDRNIAQLPCGFLLGCETASTVSSRGVYKFPVVVSNRNIYPDGQCSSYDTEYCSWSNLPDDDFLMMDDRTYTIGQFVWTGFDYLGEPTPYDEYWPSRSSYFGISDLAGLPKDRYWLYRSQWNNRDHTLHILPHWTWPGREGEVTPVYVYTDYPEAELFVNGKSQGRVRKDLTAKQICCNHEAKSPNDEVLDRYRLRWNHVTYEPGELRVVAYDNAGNACAEKTVRTAGQPSALCLECDRNGLNADGDDLAYVTVSLVDTNGTLIPYADDQLIFEVSGAGEFRAVCNGDATSLEPFTKPMMRLFNGQLVVTLQAANHSGILRLLVRDKQRKLVGSIALPVQ